MVEFAHLHLHTEFSLLDGMGRIQEYIARAQETGLHHMAVTDHGVMYGAMDWYKAGTAAGLHPIIGMEAYLADAPVGERQRKSYHLLLLAENETGYRNLLKLSTRAHLEGYYYRPRIDLEMLAQHSDGLIGTSACLSGPVAQNLLHDQADRARQYAGQLSEIFAPGRFFIEIQDHGIADQITVNRQLIPLARELDLPLVATNDVHYCGQADSPGQELLVCVQTNTTLQDPKRLKAESDQLYLKSPEEMTRVFGELPNALANTIHIAEMCDLKLEFSGYHMPHFELPAGKVADAYLRELCVEGAMRKYGHADGVVGDRLAYELGVIADMGFTNYFLVVWDFVKFAKDREILVGPGRGSAAGSLVTYSLDITALDPLRYDLIFERFLNPARISMPDIDIDFADDRRDEVIDYVVEKYGDDRVAQIVTFGTMAAKASVRDVGRAMGMSFGQTDQVAKLIPVGPGITIESAMDRVPELHKLYDVDEQVKSLIDSARKLEGIARHSSTHAAGVVISRDPLVDHVPLQRAGGKSEGDITTQYPMGQLEDIGLLKMDFLGLKTLTVVGKATALVQEEGHELSVESIPMDDAKAYALLQRGDTAGIFQLEGGMTTRMTIDVAPSSFEDLIALMALIRPGPMEMAPDYISRKHGRTPIAYMHPELESILAETYGVALYQEQVMRIANTLAGFSMAEGDGLRKAMGKKLPAEMAKYRDRFVTGCIEHGLEKPLAVDIYDMIERFAGYGFNKAHSAAYAVIAAQTAYLKANHPVEFMAALTSADIGATEKVVSNLAACRKAGIKVLPPRINASELEFSVERGDGEEKSVRFGLLAIKNVGAGAIAAMLESRAKQPDGQFADLDSFCDVTDWDRVSKRAVECLAKAGALDDFGDRASVIARLDGAIGSAQRLQKATARGQIGLFEMGSVLVAANDSTSVQVDIAPIPPKERLAWEKELLGLYLSSHPLTDVLDGKDAPGVANIIDLEDRGPSARTTVIGMVAAIRRITTKNNRSMAIVNLEDLTGSIELVVFPDCFERLGEVFQEDAIIEVSAKVERRGEQLQLVCEEATTELRSVRLRSEARLAVHVYLPCNADWWQDTGALQRLDSILRNHDGDAEVVLHVPAGRGTVALKSQSRRVDWSDGLNSALGALLGDDASRLEVREVALALAS